MPSADFGPLKLASDHQQEQSKCNESEIEFIDIILQVINYDTALEEALLSLDNLSEEHVLSCADKMQRIL